ncbi:TadE family protein [Massilia soli]|uniref:Pilus assembly protein n=1 Tax=Massilia soli TaxID=2792854 RepID=A0ABS7SIN0_9BURK|nr:TadE family protein [Massilia soli]MBZ2206062.1 pilus assembly protein [Massilia soli]
MNAYITRQRQRGIAAVELALILLATSFLLPAIFLFARVFYHYNVLKQATQDAANAMAMTPRMEMISASGMNAAKARSTQMVINAITSAGIRPPEELWVIIYCNGGVGMCIHSSAVVEINVSASFTLFDEFYIETAPWLPDTFGGPSWTFIATSNASYQN